MAKRQLRWGAIRVDGTEAIPITHEALGAPSCGRVPFLREGRWGFLDYEGEERVPPIYDFVWPFAGDGAAVEKDGEWSSIGLDGQTLEGFRGPWSEGRASFAVGKTPTRDDRAIHHAKNGYVNRRGEVVVEAQFVRALPYRHGRAIVQRFREDGSIGGHMAAIDLDGETVVGPLAAFDAASFTADGLCRVRGNTTSFYGRDGELVLETEHNQVRDFSDGLAAFLVSKPGPGYQIHHWGFLARDGSVAIEASYAEAGDFVDGVAKVSFDAGERGAIDREGRVLFRGLRYMHPFHADAAPAAIAHPKYYSSQVWGVIGRDGEWRLPAEHPLVTPFVAGVAIFKREDGSIGTVGPDGETITDGLVSAMPGGAWPLPFTKVGKRTKKGTLSGAKWGLMDREGNEVVPGIYADIRPPADGIAFVGKKVTVG